MNGFWYFALAAVVGVLCVELVVAAARQNRDHAELLAQRQRTPLEKPEGNSRGADRGDAKPVREIARELSEYDTEFT